MTNPDVVFAKFVEENPARDPAKLHSERPDVEGVLASIDETWSIDLAAPARFRHQRGWILAAASFLIVIAIGAALSWWRDSSQPPPAGTVDPIETTEQDALSATTEWLDAVNQGDIPAVMALSSPVSRSAADQHVHEWVAGFAANAMPTQVVTCDVVNATATGAAVECQIRLTDPVAIELGVSELVAPFRYADGFVIWLPYQGGDISEVNNAYSTYLREHHETEYEAVCAPQAYEPGSVVIDKALALTGACADLAAPLSDTVAQWIREGRPMPGG